MKIKIIFFLSFTISQLCHAWWFNIIPLNQLMQKYPDIEYQHGFNETYFNFQPFPLSINPNGHPNSGFFHKTFILTIPNGTVQSEYGFVLIENNFIEEMIWKTLTHNLRFLEKIDVSEIIHIHGKIAVISQMAFFNYWHWLTEVLCRLALLEMHGIEFDYLYVPQSAHFMKETLELWGIDPKKIIDPIDKKFCIQADQIILPSLVSSVSFGFVPFACYTQPHLLDYVKEKLLNAALQHTPTQTLSKKIFISRKDTNLRNIINEDEVFKLFEQKGFVRYELSQLKVIDQILLFHNAEIIVCPQGTGLANCMFCNKNVKIIELLQGLNDCTFWYLSQTLNLNYTAVPTTEFISDYVNAWRSATLMPLSIIKSVIDSLQN